MSNTTIHDSPWCSIGDVSGEHAGHGNTTLLASMKICTILAIWGLALSC